MKMRFLATVMAVTTATAAQAVPLRFDQPVGSPEGYTYYFDDGVYTTTTMQFLGVGTDAGTTVDLRISTQIKPETLFAQSYGTSSYSDDLGYIPNYTSGTTAEPNDDLGFQYVGQNLNATENGISMLFEFFDGTAALAGTFLETLKVPELNFALYDVDGEPSQSEFFRAFRSDGLVAYALGNTEQAVTATQVDADTFRFDGPGQNFGEADASGAAILTYRDTSAFTIDIGSVQTSGSTSNIVFSAFDGDLSFIDPLDFKTPVNVALTSVAASVPLPAGLPLILSGMAAFALLRRRRP